MKFFWIIIPAMLLWFESGLVVHAQETSSPDSEPTPSTHHSTQAVNQTLPVMMEIIILTKPMISVKETADSPNAIEEPPSAVVVQTDEVGPATSSSSLLIRPSSTAESASTIMTAPTMLALSMQMHNMLTGHQRRLGILVGGLAAGVVALVISWVIILIGRRTRTRGDDEERYYKNNDDGMADDEEEEDDLEAQRESASRNGSAAGAAAAAIDGFPPAYRTQDLVLAMNIGIVIPPSRRSSMSSAPPAYVEPPSYGDSVTPAR